MGKYTLDDIDWLRVCFESHDDGLGLQIANKCRKHFDMKDTHIRFSAAQKDFMSYKLESEFITEGERIAIMKAVGLV